MYYLKSLFYNFLTIFFANYLLPGIVVMSQTKLPHFGGDLLFAAALGILNSLIYPLLKLFHSLSPMRLAIASIFLNFIVYALVKVMPIGIKIMSWEGYLLPAALVTVVSFLTNYFEMRHHKVSMAAPSFPSSFTDQPKI